MSRLSNRTVLCAAALLAVMAAAVDAAPPEVGSQVPDISLPSLSGEALVLSERLASGPVVLVFFRGAW